jgi:multidrug efflux pump subunit AcrB
MVAALIRIALRRPYTFIVLAIVIALFGVLSAVSMATDIFPDIDIPVVAVAWTYTGLSPDDMAGRVIYYYERTLSLAVNDIDHIESQSLTGIGIVKIFFHPGVDIRTATAQVTSVSQTVLKQMPPGITPPLIVNYSAATVPILQLGLSSDTLAEKDIFDLGQNFIRPALASVQGAAVTSPYGGRVRQVQIDLDPEKLQADHLSAQDLENALAAQSQIIPAGTIKVGGFEYNVKLNNTPGIIDQLNDLPIKQVNGSTIYFRDVGHVYDGSPPQTNIVRMNGRRGVLMTILKSGQTSTLDIVNNVRAQIPRLKQTLPSSLKILPLADQSIFVRAAISGVVREGAIAAALTGLMILLFLGSWRSTLIIVISIPLAILFSLSLLSVMGQTLNLMTLGGLALAVGILVDDATVTIENINWHLEQGKSVPQAILDGAQQIVVPAFVSLLCICIAFVPMFFLPGVSGYLFKPMAMAVVFALIGSFILSRTLVNTLASYFLTEHGDSKDVAVARTHDSSRGHHPKNPLVRFQHGFEKRFERVRSAYHGYLTYAMERRGRFAIGFVAFVLLSFLLVPFLGENFFPQVDAGAIALHVRAPVGTRIEETAALFDHVENRVRQVIPPDQLGAIVDNIGLPNSSTGTIYSNTGTLGPEDGDILISLNENHAPTADYIKRLRTVLPESFPGSTFSFPPADMVSQVLNFGAPAPIDVQVAGPDPGKDLAYATELRNRIVGIPGAVDVRLQQSSSYPTFGVDVDRTRAGQVGISERDVTNSMVVNLAGSAQVAPTYWLNPKNGVSYPIVIQTPQYQLDTLEDLKNLPITSASETMPQILGGISDIHREDTNAVVSHYAIQPAFDVYAATQDRDLGAVASSIQRVLDQTQHDLPAGATVTIRGQVQTMNQAFSGLFFGLAEAVVLIYLLIVVNFHSWSDPFVIITALPAALAGIVWTLFATHTTLSVPALTGAIMCMGVATANSILVVSFARERLEATGEAVRAAIEAGVTRFRPVLMTALAMIIGMAPMALGMGEGGEQNAPLGRAVIGGLIFATFATLFFVPAVFAMVRGRSAHGSSAHGPLLSGESHVPAE